MIQRPCPHCTRPIVAVERLSEIAINDENAERRGERRMIRNPDRSGWIEHADGSRCAVADIDPWLGGGA